MSKTFTYKGYTGSIEFSLEDQCLFGKILFINDLIIYEAETVPQLETSFKSAVDDYIETCAELGRQPQKPFKGSLNVRIGEELHKRAALKAACDSITLNEVVKNALENYLCQEPVVNHHLEHHEHHHHHYPPSMIEINSTFSNVTGGKSWKQSTPISKLH